jgi:hypothetical protein
MATCIMCAPTSAISAAPLILDGQGGHDSLPLEPARAHEIRQKEETEVGRRPGTFVDVIELVCDEPWGKGS